MLAEEAFPLDPDRDYRITVEAIGSSIKVDLDGVPVFDCDDDAIRTGGIGLYGSAGSRFSDLRVDDFRPVVPAAYKFRFVTSRFTNFLHHLHSYRDEARPVELPADVDLGPASSAAVPPEGRPTDAEARAYPRPAPARPRHRDNAGPDRGGDLPHRAGRDDVGAPVAESPSRSTGSVLR